MLLVEGLSVRYGRIPALHGIRVEVGAGQAVAVVGPNGAGKSTLLRTIAGAVRPSGGDVKLEGDSIATLKPESIVRRGVALVPERRRIFARLTVGENLRVATAGRTTSTSVKDDIDALLVRFPVLKRYYDKPAAGLSGGEQQQLAIARALLSRPQLLLLDEPSLGLAPTVASDVFDTLTELRREGMTVLLVEQHVRKALEFADYAYALSSGRIVGEGSAREMLERDVLGDLYLSAKP